MEPPVLAQKYGAQNLKLASEVEGSLWRLELAASDANSGDPVSKSN